jgi:hypothetical protein
VNIIDYVKHEQRSFKAYSFNDIDSLILTTLNYIDWTNYNNFYLKDLNIQNFKKQFIGINDGKYYQELLQNIILNPRFNDLKIVNYVNKVNLAKEFHFGAMTFVSKELVYVSFMGTIKSLISWKEDFDMVYKLPIPSQSLAINYLNDVCLKYYFKAIYVGGHSKGGNLSIYAASNAPFLSKIRIVKVYSHDGPGFPLSFLKGSKYASIKSKISKTVPASSIVGMLLYSDNDYKVVKSNAIGIMQHSPFTWLLNTNGFLYLNDRNWDSKYFDKAISTWIEGISLKEREEFINTLFNILAKVDFNKIDISKTSNWLNIYMVIKKGEKELSPENKKMLIIVIKKLKQAELKYLLSKNY